MTSFLSWPSRRNCATKYTPWSSVSVPPTAPQILDLDPAIFRLLQKEKMLALFGVCRQTYLEASHRFFSTHTFRLFPTEPRYFSTKRPLLARLPPGYRSSITSLELRLGPGWNAPPRGWAVSDALGLKDCINVRGTEGIRGG